MLFQTDEIDGMLQSINKAKDARHEAIMGTLLTMYSSANSVFPMRRKAGKEAPGAIDQPCLVVFGTAIPNHYYEALSDRMLTNGFRQPDTRGIELHEHPRPWTCAKRRNHNSLVSSLFFLNARAQADIMGRTGYVER